MLGRFAKFLGNKALEGAWRFPGAQKTVAAVRGAGSSAVSALSHPALKYGIPAVAGIYGYSSTDGSFGNKLEKGLGYAAIGGAGVSTRFRGMVSRQSRALTMGVRRHGVKNGVAGWASNMVGLEKTIHRVPGGFKDPYFGEVMVRAGHKLTGNRMGGVIGASVAGGLYGALSEDTSIINGAITGGAMMMLSKSAAKSIVGGQPFSAATGALAGGIAGQALGGPVGMSIGTKLGAGAGIAAGAWNRLNKTNPRLAKYVGAALVGGGLGTGMVGMSAHEAYGTYKRNNLGADGDLALGLHAMRHG